MSNNNNDDDDDILTADGEAATTSATGPAATAAAVSASSRPLTGNDNDDNDNHNNENDPSNYLRNISSTTSSSSSSNNKKTIVKVHDSTIQNLNGQLGIVERYNRYRGRYDVRFIIINGNVGSIGNNSDDGWLSLLVASLFSITTIGNNDNIIVALRPHNVERATNKETKRHRLLQFLLKYHVVPLIIATLIMITSIFINGVDEGLYFGAISILALVLILYFLAPKSAISSDLRQGGGGGDPRGGGSSGRGNPHQQPQRGRDNDTFRSRRSDGRNSPSPDPDRGVGNSMNASPRNNNPWDIMKKIGALIVGGLVLGRIGMNAMNSEPKLRDKIFNLLGYAYTQGHDRHTIDGLPYLSLQEQYNAAVTANEQFDSSSLLVHFIPPQNDPTLEVEDASNPQKEKISIQELDIGEYTEMIVFWEALCHGLELFYSLGYNDAIEGEPRSGSANLHKQQNQLIADSGLMPYL